MSILTILIEIPIKNLKFDYDFENFFPKEDVDFAFYTTYLKNFETDNDFILLAIKNQNGVFKTSFLQKIQPNH